MIATPLGDRRAVRLALAAAMLLLHAGGLAAQDPAGAAPEVSADTAAARVSAPTAPRNRATLAYERSQFADGVAPWSFAYLQLARRGSRGTLVGRVNYARRFALDGMQAEVDAYPKLREGTYAYLNAGFASTAVFPDVRLGGELYTSLPRAMEISAGARWMDFDSGSVVIYTGSVGKYVRNYWISLRPFVTPREGDLSASANLSIRRYLTDPEQYVTLLLGAGTQPDERFVPGAVTRLRSARALLDGRAGAVGPLALRWSLGYERIELPTARQRDRFSAGLGVERSF